MLGLKLNRVNKKGLLGSGDKVTGSVVTEIYDDIASL